MHQSWTRRRLLATGATAATIAVAGCVTDNLPTHAETESPLPVATAIQYSDPGCSCCHKYADYLGDHLPGALDERHPDDLAAVKARHDIPTALQSCHTLELDDYVIEGHVPAGVIATLLDDAPTFDGIALPGMPTGSPGMGGKKTAAFTFYVLGGGRTGDVYLEG